MSTTSSTINATTATVRCPINEPSPSPTVNPMIASSSSHNPLFIISDADGDRNCWE